MTVTFGNPPIGRFVYKKQSKIRWHTESVFVSGSWDDNENDVTLWQWLDDGQNNEKPQEPQLLASFDHSFGDVNEIQFLEHESGRLLVASSDGSVSLLRIATNPSVNRESTGYQLTLVNKWNKLHSCSSFKNSCNSLTYMSDHIVSVGSAGQMCLLNIKKEKPIKIYKSADSGSMSSVIFMKQEEVASANNRGQVKLWDLRSNHENPNKTCHLAMDLVGITSIAKHPTKPYIMVAGGSNGVLAFWDLRGQQDYPLSVVKAHSDAVSEVHFHDHQPDHMFTCSQSGDVWHWNGTVAKSSYFAQNSSEDMGCIWLNSEFKNRVDTKPVLAKQPLPANSMSIYGSNVLVAGDNEAIYVIPKIDL